MRYKTKSILSHDAENCLKELLKDRGITDVINYCNPSDIFELDPTLLDNIDDAAILLKKHLDNDSKILFIVDCDCDGYCSSAMLWTYIQDIYPFAKLEYICHEHKAHGFEDIIDKIIDKDYDLIICPDAGSSDYEQHKLLKEKGIDILILDHHLTDGYSEYAVVVNNQLSEHYTNKKLCGAGVVYKFLNYFDKTYGYNNAKKFLDLCALANIADCMSMSDLETRYYIVEGLKNINNGCFKSLIESQSYSLFQGSKELNYIKIAFYIAPLINAMVRVGTETEKNELFESFIYPEKLIQSTKRGAEIGELVPLSVEIARKAINAKNRQNRLKEKAIDIIDMRIQKEGLLDNKIIIAEIYEEDKIPQELTGLLATHFVNKYNRPCIIVRRNDEGFLRGSIRGNDTFEEIPDLKEFLENSGVTEYVQG